MASTSAETVTSAGGWGDGVAELADAFASVPEHDVGGQEGHAAADLVGFEVHRGLGTDEVDAEVHLPSVGELQDLVDGVRSCLHGRGDQARARSPWSLPPGTSSSSADLLDSRALPLGLYHFWVGLVHPQDDEPGALGRARQPVRLLVRSG